MPVIVDVIHSQIASSQQPPISLHESPCLLGKAPLAAPSLVVPDTAEPHVDESHACKTSERGQARRELVPLVRLAQDPFHTIQLPAVLHAHHLSVLRIAEEPVPNHVAVRSEPAG